MRARFARVDPRVRLALDSGYVDFDQDCVHGLLLGLWRSCCRGLRLELLGERAHPRRPSAGRAHGVVHLFPSVSVTVEVAVLKLDPGAMHSLAR